MAPEAVLLTPAHPVELLEGQASRARASGQRPDGTGRDKEGSPALVLERMGAGAGPGDPGIMRAASSPRLCCPVL